jgi:hypothetical protein
MTGIIRKILYTTGLVGVFFLFSSVGCYSLSGAKIPAGATTVSIPFFPNNAALVTPTLSATFTDALQEKFANQTKLELVDPLQDADLAFEGAITNYVATPTAVTASSDFPASMMRLTITVRVSFTNRLEPEWNFTNRTFSHYEDFDSNLTLQSQEGTLIPIIVEKLVDDIYMAAVANW